MNENSTILWYKRLGYISREMMERLIKNEIMTSLDFSYFISCVECIKGKYTKVNKKGASRATELLECIHFDIWGLIQFQPSMDISTLLVLLMTFQGILMCILFRKNLKH